MKKKVIIAVTVLALIAASAYIYATVSARGTLTMDIEKAYADVFCNYEISASGKLIHAKMELYQDGELVGTWEDEARDRLELCGVVDAVSEASGHLYHIVVLRARHRTGAEGNSVMR